MTGVLEHFVWLSFFAIYATWFLGWGRAEWWASAAGGAFAVLFFIEACVVWRKVATNGARNRSGE